jgi:hypothetical protein
MLWSTEAPADEIKKHVLEFQENTVVSKERGH